MSFTGLVKIETSQARRKFPPIHTHHEAYAIIKEELDEYWEELRKHDRKDSNLLEELIQIGAMAQRAAEDLILNEK